jgi:UDP-N-acetylglucosamine:LPS N-acetylglucosamine transferase
VGADSSITAFFKLSMNNFSKIMIVSRGHGRGHAVPDMAIASQLAGLISDCEFQFVSYAAGAEVYRTFGHEVIDLHLPDNPPLWDLVIAFTKLLKDNKPDLLVSHEEVGIVPIASAFGIQTIVITDFFLDPSTIFMYALRNAAEIIFLAQQGLYTEPPYLSGKVHYVGRAVRRFEYTLTDRARAREELGIPHNALVALFQPGAWRESQVSLASLLAAAWDLVPCVPKRLIWIAGSDYSTLSEQLRDRSDIVLLKEDWKIDRLMAASNLVITKANRVTVYEASALGLPSISISGVINWPDDVAMASVESNTALLLGPEDFPHVTSITPAQLASLIIDSSTKCLRPATDLSHGIAGAAARIAHRINARRGEDAEASISRTA